MKKQIFETDGVRGIPGKEPFTSNSLEALGRGIARTLRTHTNKTEPHILLVRDTRASGNWIARSLCAGIRSQKLGVINAGILPTPAAACLVPRKKLSGGIVISASHNPPEFNGVKVFAPNGWKVPQTWEREIESCFYENGGKIAADHKKSGSNLSRAMQAAAEYSGFLSKTLPEGSSLAGLKIVIDCANGATSRIAPKLFDSFGAKTTVVNSSPDGKNINVNCGSQHPENLKFIVRSLGADAGIAFDGDGDRAVFVDETGRLCDGDHVLAIMAVHLKTRKELKGNAVIVTVMANGGLLRVLEDMGIKVISVPVGDREVAQAMARHGACLGGEQSGHIIFNDFLPTGDGLLTALQVLSVLKYTGKSLSELSGVMVKNPQALVNVRVAKKIPLDDSKELNAAIKSAKRELGPYGRIVVRYSGTEPLLRIMVEGPAETKVKKCAASLENCAKKLLQ